jgi:hypothetical protein
MTTKQKETACQIMMEYEERYCPEPQTVNMGHREVIIRRSGPMMHPYYKMLPGDKILFGVGMEYTQYDDLVIGIGKWTIINADGSILDSTQYNATEQEEANQMVEISGFNLRSDLLKFNLNFS